MGYLATAALIGWLLYSWSVALGLIMVCGVISLFYAGALEGDAQSKVVRCFAGMVLVMTLVMVGVVTQRIAYENDGPKTCAAVQC